MINQLASTELPEKFTFRDIFEAACLDPEMDGFAEQTLNDLGVDDFTFLCSFDEQMNEDDGDDDFEPDMATSYYFRYAPDCLIVGVSVTDTSYMVSIINTHDDDGSYIDNEHTDAHLCIPDVFKQLLANCKDLNLIPYGFEITTDEEFDLLKPIKNHIDDNASLDGVMFETYGEELSFVKSKESKYVWTYMEDDDEKIFFVSGFKSEESLGFCPIGYLVTEVAFSGPESKVLINDFISTH